MKHIIATKNTITILSNMKILKKKEITNSYCKSFAQMFASNLSKITKQKAQLKVIGSSQRQKAIILNTSKIKSEKKK